MRSSAELTVPLRHVPNHDAGPISKAAIPDLIRQLTEDSKRLAIDEVRLAKLELAERVRMGSRGAIELAVAFGAGVVALTALTICSITLIGAAAGNRLWTGALVTGIVELVVGYLLVRRGSSRLATRSYSLPETRQSLKRTPARDRPPQAD